MSDGQVVIDITADDAGFKKKLKSLGGVASSAFSGIAKSASFAIGAGTAVLTAGISAFTAKGVKLASDLAEVQNVVDVTFGPEGSKKIDKWSKDAAAAFGISELQAKKWTGTAGAMLQSMGLTEKESLGMSEGLAGLAGDFASFYNLDHEDAWQKIRAGIAGETEPLKQIGINMSVANLEAFAASKGIKKAFKNMSQAEQTQLRYAYLMDVSSKAQGDFARTSDSLANQQRILQMQVDSAAASLGKTLIPVLSKLLGAVMPMIEAAGPMLETFGNGLAKLLGGDMSGAEDVAKGLKGLVNIAADLVKSLMPGLVAGLAQVIVAVAQALPGLLPVLMNALIIGLMAIADALPQILPALVNGLMAVITQLAAALPTLLPALVQGFIALITAISAQLPTLAPLLADAVVQIIVALANVIAQSAPVLIPAIIQAVVLIAGALIAALPQIATAALVMFKGILKGLQDSVPAILAVLPKLWTKIKTAFVAAWPLLLKAGKDLLMQAKLGIEQTSGRLIALTKSLVGEKLYNAAVDSIKKFLDVGKNIANGIKEGISNTWSSLTAKLKKLVNLLPETVKKLLGIHSPSRVFIRIGKNITQGLVKGLTGDAESIKTAAAKLSDYVTKAVEAAPKKAKAAARAAAEDARAIIKKQTQVLSKLATQHDAVTAKLESARDALKALKDEAASYASSVSSGIKATLSDLAQGEDVTMDSMLTKLRGRLDAARQYAANLATLRARGLNDAMLRELSTMGVEAGGKVASLLATASDAQLAELNTTAAEIANIADATGQQMADKFYSAGISAAEGLVKGLEDKQADIEATMAEIARKMVKAVKKEMKIKSPSRVMAWVGRMTTDGWAGGLTRGAVDVIGAVRDTATSLVDAAKSPVLTTALGIGPVAMPGVYSPAISGAMASGGGSALLSNSRTVNVEQNFYVPTPSYGDTKRAGLDAARAAVREI